MSVKYHPNDIVANQAMYFRKIGIPHRKANKLSQHAIKLSKDIADFKNKHSNIDVLNFDQFLYISSIMVGA